MNNVATAAMDMVSDSSKGFELETSIFASSIELKYLASIFASIWRTVGVEFLMFAITVVLAYAIQIAPRTPFQKKSCADSIDNDLPAVQSPRKPRAHVASHAAEKITADAAVRPEQFQPWVLIDDIMDMMHKYPGQRSAGRCLQIFSELRLRIRPDENAEHPGNMSMLEAVQRSKTDGMEFFSMLVGCAVRTQNCALVENIVDDMVRHKIPRSYEFYERTMKQVAGQKQHQLALNIYDRLHADGLEASPVTYSCLISFAAEAGHLNRAVGFFEKLSSISTPSIRAYMTVLRVLSKQRDWPRSLATFRDMQERNVKVDAPVLNIVLATGVTADMVEEVEALLANGCPSHVRDTVSYNTVINGYARRSDGASACRAVVSMRECGLQPTTITFNTVMDAIVRDHRCGNDVAWKVLEQMRKTQMNPDKFTCSILVKGFCKSPAVDQVKPVLEVLEEARNSCDMKLKSTLYHGVLDVAAKLSDEAFMRTMSQMVKNHVVLTDLARMKFRERLHRACM